MPLSSALLDLILKSLSGYQVSTISSTWYNFPSQTYLFSPLTSWLTVFDSHLRLHTRSNWPTVDDILGSYWSRNCHVSCWWDVASRNQCNSCRGNNEGFTVWSCRSFFHLHLRFRLRCNLVDSAFAIPCRDISSRSQIERQRMGRREMECWEWRAGMNIGPLILYLTNIRPRLCYALLCLTTSGKRCSTSSP